MGIRTGQAYGGIYRLNPDDLLPSNSAVWICFWFKHHTSPENWGSMFIINDAGFSGYDYIGVDNAGKWRLSGNIGSDTGIDIDIDVWHHAAMVRESSIGATKFYIDGEVIAEYSGDMSGRPAPSVNAAGFVYGTGQSSNIDIAYMRAGLGSRTQSEIQDEMTSEFPVHTSGLWGEWLFPNDENLASDTSGNGHHWSLSGTPVWTSDPDISGSEVIESGTLDVSAVAEVVIASSEVISPESEVIESGILSVTVIPVVEIASAQRERLSGALLVQAYPIIDIISEQNDTVAIVTVMIESSSSVASIVRESSSTRTYQRTAVDVTSYAGALTQ